MLCTMKCHCLTKHCIHFGSPQQDRNGRNKRQCRGKLQTLGAQGRPGVQQKGNCRKYLQRSRSLHFGNQKKKKPTTKCTHKSYYLWELHISFRTREGVSKASEADLQFLNADKQMELSTMMSDRQKVAAAVIMAQIKLTEHPWDQDMSKSQNDIQK